MRPTGCIRCGAAGAHVLHPLELVACESCAHAWIAEESLSVTAIEAVVGIFGKSGKSYVEHEAAFDAELLKRTLEWAKTARAAA